MSNKTTARKILTEIQYATIATANKEGGPWNTPVFYASDGYILYWSSHPDSVHSKNIAASGKAFIVIYNSKTSEGDGTGLYIKATVHALEHKEEIARALNLLGKRRGSPFKHIAKFIEGCSQRVYKAEPLQLWTNDAHKDADGDFIQDFRIEIAVKN